MSKRMGRPMQQRWIVLLDLTLGMREVAIAGLNLESPSQVLLFLVALRGWKLLSSGFVIRFRLSLQSNKTRRG